MERSELYVLQMSQMRQAQNGRNASSGIVPRGLRRRRTPPARCEAQRRLPLAALLHATTLTEDFLQARAGAQKPHGCLLRPRMRLPEFDAPRAIPSGPASPVRAGCGATSCIPHPAGVRVPLVHRGRVRRGDKRAACRLLPIDASAKKAEACASAFFCLYPFSLLKNVQKIKQGA
jgi:hypothetical protein